VLASSALVVLYWALHLLAAGHVEHAPLHVDLLLVGPAGLQVRDQLVHDATVVKPLVGARLSERRRHAILH